MVKKKKRKKKQRKRFLRVPNRNVYHFNLKPVVFDVVL